MHWALLKEGINQGLQNSKPGEVSSCAISQPVEICARASPFKRSDQRVVDECRTQRQQIVRVQSRAKPCPSFQTDQLPFNAWKEVKRLIFEAIRNDSAKGRRAGRQGRKGSKEREIGMGRQLLIPRALNPIEV